MVMPIRKDRFDLIKLTCIICKITFERAKYLEESRVQQNKLGPVCSPHCSGKLGWLKKKDLKRESSLIEKD
jgi:hypothetical protein